MFLREAGSGKRAAALYHNELARQHLPSGKESNWWQKPGEKRD